MAAAGRFSRGPRSVAQGWVPTAAIVGAIYGIPLLTLFAKKGWALPQAMDSYGFAIGEKLFPTYSAGLIVGTMLLVFVTTTIVSFLPTRKIAKLKPTEALRGRMS